MKLLWFHLMPYTDLPEDFRDKHPSVWVDIDSRLFDPAKAHDPILRAWNDPNPFAWNGRFDQLRCVNVWPREISA
jgi:hypothetical protein